MWFSMEYGENGQNVLYILFWTPECATRTFELARSINGQHGFERGSRACLERPRASCHIVSLRMRYELYRNMDTHATHIQVGACK